MHTGALTPALASAYRVGFTEVPGNLFGSECGPPPEGGRPRIDARNASAWGAAALRAARASAPSGTADDGEDDDARRGMQAAQLALARRAAATFFAAHAGGRADARALLAAAGTADAPWLFMDAATRLVAVK